MNHKTARYAGIKTTLFTALLAALTCTGALANSGGNAQHFEGFSLGVDMNFETQSYKSMDFSKLWADDTRHKENVAPTIHMGVTANYRVALGQDFVLGVGAKVNLGDTAVRNQHFHHTLEGSQAIFLSPGYAVSPKIMVFGKLGQVTRKARGLSKSTDFEGTQYGLGVLYALTPQVHANVEYTIDDYAKKHSETWFKKTTTRAESGTLSVGLAYRF